MDFEILRERISSGDYTAKKSDYIKTELVSNDHIFDEDKSVKWNREECQRINLQHKQEWRDYRIAENNYNKKFHNDCVNAIMDDTNFNLSVSERIFSKAYEDGHAYGYGEVVTRCEELCSFVTDILDRVG